MSDIFVAEDIKKDRGKSVDPVKDDPSPKTSSPKDEAPQPYGRGIFSLLLRRERNPSEAENSSHSSPGLWFDDTHHPEPAEGRPRFSAKGDKTATETLTHPKTHAEKEKLPEHTHNPLAAFCLYPDRASFVNKDPEEKIVLLLRKHPITNLSWIALAFVMLIAPGFVSVFEFFAGLPMQLQAILIIFWYLLTTAFIFEEFLSWFFHVNIVTDERIIEVDFVNLIYREITDANINQIQDVTVELGGTARTFFNYGNVIVQTAAVIPKIDFEAVPKPDKVAKILRELRIEEEVEKLEGRVR